MIFLPAITFGHFLGIDDINADPDNKCCLYRSDVLGAISLKFFNFLFIISPRYKIFYLIKKLTKMHIKFHWKIYTNTITNY